MLIAFQYDVHQLGYIRYVDGIIAIDISIVLDKRWVVYIKDILN